MRFLLQLYFTTILTILLTTIELSQTAKRRKENAKRNHIEGKFGQGKNAYGLSRIRARRQDTSESWIAAIFFVMNLVRLTKTAKFFFLFCFNLEKCTTGAN